jgi:hypothetical protein
MVKTVSEPGEAVDWTEAVASEAPGTEAIDIQSSGITKRAKTLPLKPLPFSADDEAMDLAAGAETLLSEVLGPPDDATVGSESA